MERTLNVFVTILPQNMRGYETWGDCWSLLFKMWCRSQDIKVDIYSAQQQLTCPGKQLCYDSKIKNVITISD